MCGPSRPPAPRPPRARPSLTCVSQEAPLPGPRPDIPGPQLTGSSGAAPQRPGPNVVPFRDNKCPRLGGPWTATPRRHVTRSPRPHPRSDRIGHHPTCPAPAAAIPSPYEKNPSATSQRPAPSRASTLSATPARGSLLERAASPFGSHEKGRASCQSATPSDPHVAHLPPLRSRLASRASRYLVLRTLSSAPLAFSSRLASFAARLASLAARLAISPRLHPPRRPPPRHQAAP